MSSFKRCVTVCCTYLFVSFSIFLLTSNVSAKSEQQHLEKPKTILDSSQTFNGINPLMTGKDSLISSVSIIDITIGFTALLALILSFIALLQKNNLDEEQELLITKILSDPQLAEHFSKIQRELDNSIKEKVAAIPIPQPIYTEIPVIERVKMVPTQTQISTHHITPQQPKSPIVEQVFSIDEHMEKRIFTFLQAVYNYINENNLQPNNEEEYELLISDLPKQISHKLTIENLDTFIRYIKRRLLNYDNKKIATCKFISYYDIREDIRFHCQAASISDLVELISLLNKGGE